MTPEDSDKPEPLSYAPAWDSAEPRPRDRISGAARLISSAVVALTGAVLIGTAPKPAQGWGTFLLIAGMVAFICEYLASLWGR